MKSKILDRMNYIPKVALQLTRCSFFMSLYALHFKYQDQYHISRTHLQRWITACQESGIGALKPFSPKS